MARGLMPLSLTAHGELVILAYEEIDMRRFIIIAAILAMGAYRPPGPHANNIYDINVSGSAFSALSINSAKTFDAIDVGGYHTVLVEIQYAYSAGTAVNMTCDESPDNSTWFKVPQANESSPPIVSHGQRIWTWSGTASVNFFFEVPVRYRYLRCSIYTTGGDASDVATVTATAAE